MKVLYAASEAYPFAMSGGLADVAGALPKALRKRFVGCRIVLPLYGSISEEMRQKMEWEDWYGTNLDALWDILTGLPYRGDDFLILRPRYYSGIPYGRDAIFTQAVDKICDIFLDAQAEYDSIRVEIVYTEAF